MLLIGGLFGSVAAGFRDVIGLYMATYFWGFTTSQLVLLVYASGVSILLAFAIARPITERFDKKKSMVGLATFVVFLGPLPVFLRLLELMPENGNPMLLSLFLGYVLIIVTAAVSMRIIFSSMIADLVDENELATGNRQEGMFMAAITFVDKATDGIGSLLAGIALDMIHFPSGAEPGTIPPDKIFNLGLVVGPGLMVLSILSLIFFSRYRLTRERHREILTALEHRRGESFSRHLAAHR